MSNGARTKIQMWIYAIALFVLTAELHGSGDAATGAATALIVISTMLVAFALVGGHRPDDGFRMRAATAPRRDHGSTASRQCDPTAAGHTRARAPGSAFRAH